MNAWTTDLLFCWRSCCCYQSSFCQWTCMPLLAPLLLQASSLLLFCLITGATTVFSDAGIAADACWLPFYCWRPFTCYCMRLCYGAGAHIVLTSLLLLAQVACMRTWCCWCPCCLSAPAVQTFFSSELCDWSFFLGYGRKLLECPISDFYSSKITGY